MNRVQSLQSLLKLDQPLSQILPSLNAFSWDSDCPADRLRQRELVTLKRQHIVNVLNRYLSSELPKSCIEDWANAIEGREDIGFEDLLSEVIYQLANPLLTHSLSRDLAKNQLEQLVSESNEQAQLRM